MIEHGFLTDREFQQAHTGEWPADPPAIEPPPARTQIKEIPICELRAAPWNYKPEGTPEQRAKLVESIKRDGSAGVLAVRLICVEEDGYQCWWHEVIDGNHRLAAVQEAGWNTVFCEDFGQISLATAITIARRRNEQWYDVDKEAYARLFAEQVIPEIGLEELAAFMPDTMVEMENTLAEGLHNFSVSQAPEPVYAPPSGDSGFVSFTVSMPTEAWLGYERIKSAVARVLAADRTPLNADPALAHGQILELLAADAAMGGMGGLIE